MGGSDQLQVIVTGLSVPVGLAFEAGDLYIVNTNTSPPTAINNTVSVFPERNGTLFGVPVTRHVLTTVFSGLSAPTGLAFDDRGNLMSRTLKTALSRFSPRPAARSSGWRSLKTNRPRWSRR